MSAADAPPHEASENIRVFCSPCSSPSVRQCECKLGAPLAHSRPKCSSFWAACKHQRMQRALPDRSADFPEGEERDQCDSKDDPHKKHPARSSAADAGDAFPDRLPLE